MLPSPAERAEGNWAGVLPVEQGLGKAPALLHPHRCPQFSLLPSTRTLPFWKACVLGVSVQLSQQTELGNCLVKAHHKKA